ncbi:MAG: anhydro-N-acetylmuramic acid kinase [Candidatus Lambdaproteobacteria bacterium]|nr:anhydro-N-acetylmuramic acid kinase [Candidatus Lambdaproteobacteria bacterium]
MSASSAPPVPQALPRRIARLAAMAAAARRRILGLMSGTSLDGLDLALCDVTGHGRATRVQVLAHDTRPYDAAQRARLRALASQEQVALAELTLAHAWLAELHAQAVLEALARWGVDVAGVDCIASHGQTVYHAPRGPHGLRATLQIGDGDRLARRTGLPVVSDFRQKELAAGGEGAPLAPYADALLFGDTAIPRLLLNLGGIANFTWLSAGRGTARVRYGDTGPANTLLDRVVRERLPRHAEGYDRDGALAARGRTHAGLLAALKAHAYFRQPCPKSTGPETFGADYLRAAQAAAGADHVSPADLLATLVRLTAETVADTLRAELPVTPGAEVLASGGGTHNRTLLAALRETLEPVLPAARWRDLAEFGVPGDAKEAVLFAVLANETLAGEGFDVPLGGDPRAVGAGAGVSFGKLSFPD